MIYNSVNQIYLYQGEGESRAGVDKAGVDKLVELLPQYFFGSKLKLIDGKEIQPDKWNPSGTLFVLPGGACSEWKWINTDTVKKVQEFVDKGGKIFAICAGAFCLSREVEYTLSTDTVLKKKRGFDFFSGKAIGPLLLDSMPKDTPLSLVVCAVKVQLEKTLQGSSSCGSAILAGGGYFVPDEKPLHPYEVLATYKKAPSDQSVAAVKCFVGKGTVVLSFIHWEYDYSDYPQEALTQLFPK